ncbi:MAG: hypothetical protein IKR48_13355 [Kiritimatiellae bacterium]|nr:hypothetical protein [Kiritimatiellia bacterium]
MTPFLKRLPKPTSFQDFSEPSSFHNWMKFACLIAVAFGIVLLIVSLCIKGCRKDETETSSDKKEPAKGEVRLPDLTKAVRAIPATFGRNTSLPLGRESKNAGAIDLATFNPVSDLIHFDDSRVWFESDNKKSSEYDNDHLVHRAMEWPLRRLVNLVDAKGGKLKVHDTYRSADKNKIHTEKSLHCEGRAIDLTSEKISLSELAKLCWAAGFDYVLYEPPGRSGGEHIHTSVKRDHAQQDFEKPAPVPTDKK